MGIGNIGVEGHTVAELMAGLEGEDIDGLADLVGGPEDTRTETSRVSVEFVFMAVVREFRILVLGLHKHIETIRLRDLIHRPEVHRQLTVVGACREEEGTVVADGLAVDGAQALALEIAGVGFHFAALQVFARERHDVDHTPIGILTVERRTRAAHDLDALDVLQHEEVEAGMLRKTTLIPGVIGNTVDQQQHAAGKRVLAERTDVHRLDHGIPTYVDAGHQA